MEKQKEVDWRTFQELRKLLKKYYTMKPIKEITEDIVLPEEMRRFHPALDMRGDNIAGFFTVENIEWQCEGDPIRLQDHFLSLFSMAGQQTMAGLLEKKQKELDKMLEREQYWWRQNDELQARIKELEQYAPEHLRSKVNPDAKAEAIKLVTEMIDELEQML